MRRSFGTSLRGIEVLFVDKDAGRGDDPLANEHVIGTLRVARASEEGAHPAARAEAGFMLVRRRLEDAAGKSHRFLRDAASVESGPR
jgi:hypothetical protein